MINLAVKYALFAAVSTVGNLLTQHMVQIFVLHTFMGRYSIYPAIFLGTLVGLVIKYTLDKRFIFFYNTKNQAENAGKFLLYSFMGIFTTLIFWFFELLFNSLFEFDLAKYIGAVIGLTIGYVLKYNLDKKFVFKKFV
ncbi:MAG: GtrA family protein [Bacillota bacterium]